MLDSVQGGDTPACPSLLRTTGYLSLARTDFGSAPSTQHHEVARMRIFITGGSGLVGSRLIPQLRHRGDEVILLTRRPAAVEARLGSDCRVVAGDPMVAGAWMDS